jgi:riboflavin synthase
MFTGLVEDLGTVVAVQRTDGGAVVTVDSRLAEQVREGDSVAVNGVCLTATGIDGTRFGFDVMLESLRRSSLDGVDVGTRVNLELALRADARLGGHIMQGHVDGVGTVSGVRDDGFARIVTVAADPQLLRYVVEKGSIAVDGVSLTVARVDDTSFDVSLIPETLQRTNLGTLTGTTPRTVNLEVDIVAKYVEKLVARP